MEEMIMEFEEKMEKTLIALNNEFSVIRAGRANPHILDKIKVDYYGSPTPLQQVANVSVPEARMIQIQPWESSLIKEIEKAILVSDLGLTPTNDGKSIRLVFPELTEDRRKELVKDVKKNKDKYFISPERMQEMEEERLNREAEIVEFDGEIINMVCGTGTVGSYRLPKSQKTFLVVFKKDNGEIIDLAVAEEIYLSLEVGMAGKVTLLDGRLDSFELFEDDFTTEEEK